LDGIKMFIQMIRELPWVRILDQYEKLEDTVANPRPKYRRFRFH